MKSETPEEKTVDIPCNGCIYGTTFFERDTACPEAPPLHILTARVGAKLSDYGWIRTYDSRFTHSPEVPAYLCPQCQEKYCK
ncbi:MAG: hypothetical protein ACOZF0_19355 [Thermodesulfobacteriota bacterium]